MTPKLVSTGWPAPKLSNKGGFTENFLGYYTGKRILVTGGAGFLGSNLIRLLAPVKCEVIRLTRERKEVLPVEGRMRLEEAVADIRQRAIWQRLLERVDVVFHLAAQTSAGAAEEDPIADFDANVRPLLHLVETCREKGHRLDLLFAGTVTEVGIPTRLPVDETHPDRPITIYDIHKWMAEQYLKYYTDRGIVRGTCLRLANVYGPGPKSQSPDRGVLNQMIARALAGVPLTVYGSGAELRDYTYVEDVALAFLAAGAYMECVSGRHFVIGTGKGHTISEAFRLVANQVALITGRRVEVEHSPPPASASPIEARNFVADPRSFSEITGWHPRTSLPEGIAQTAKAYL